MANDRWYNPGDHYILDDLSGFKVRYSRARKIPGGQTGNLLVDISRWEPQQPQDFVRGVVDHQQVPEARPRQANRFVIVGTWVTAPTQRLHTVITVDSTVGFLVGALVQVMLDNGQPFYPTILFLGGNTMTLSLALPHGVGGYGLGNPGVGDPLENTVVQLGPGAGPFLADDHGPTFITDDYGNAFSVL
jgi:hypothetical protein